MIALLSGRENTIMALRNDLTGQQFDLLTALYPLPERKDSCVVWQCRCACGNQKAIPSTDLTRHRVKSCGCLLHRVKDITGEHRGHLTALRYTGERDENGHAIYEWRCDCGNVFTRSIAGTARKDSALLCAECQRKVKSHQINRVRADREVEETTGLTKKYLSNLIHGVLTERNTSGIRGVYWHEGHHRWVATGRVNNELITLGEFEDIAEAGKARRDHVLKTYGGVALKLGIEIV